MKTLIVIKGQLRTWNENKKYLKTYIENVVTGSTLANSQAKAFESQSVDILFSCWDISYQIYPDPFGISYINKEDIQAEEIKKFFSGSPVVRKVFFHQLKYLEVQNYFQEIDFQLDEEYHMQCFITYKTGLYKRTLEAEYGFTYDYVLELRPDVAYDYDAASKKVIFPKFGEILTQHGNVVMELHGVVSPMTEDLIFFMTGRTYDIFSKEILFHFRSVKRKAFYSTAHVEKNLFFMSNNFQINDLRNAFCSVAIIVRPTVDFEHLNSLNRNIDRITSIARADSDWRGRKQVELDTLIKKGLYLDHLADYINNLLQQNQVKIRQVLENAD